MKKSKKVALAAILCALSVLMLLLGCAVAGKRNRQIISASISAQRT